MTLSHCSERDRAFIEITTRPSAFRILLFALPLVLAVQSASAIVSVGPNNDGCVYDFDNIQGAIDRVLEKEKNLPQDVDPYISVVGGLVYNEALVIDGSSVNGYIDPLGNQRAFVQIYGDYDQGCQGTETGIPAKIGAGGSKSGNSVIEIKGDVDVVLNHFVLTDASGVDYGGGINFHGSGSLDLTNVDITGNHAHFGAGINVHGEGPGLTLSLHGSTIENNTAANSTGTSTGGGIFFNGHGSLQIENTSFYTNQADFGGGIDVDPDDSTDVQLNGGVSMFFNTANRSGGAIFVRGHTTLNDNKLPQTLVGLNKAPGGYGGGVFLVGPARADLKANIFSNTASYGGGIALAAARNLENGYALVSLSAPDPNIPVNVSGNTASHTGGGIYIAPIFDTTYNYATLCASDFRIDLNQAQEGTAIYGDEDFTLDEHIGSKIELNQGCAKPSICVASGCNEINGNIAATTSFQPTDGSTILLQTDGTLFANRVRFQKNQGAHVCAGWRWTRRILPLTTSTSAIA